MSFILDALRKSETERQRKSAPGLADAQYQVKPDKRSIWMPVLLVILAINALIITFLLVDDTTELTSADAPAPPVPRVTESPPVLPAAAPAAVPSPTAVSVSRPLPKSVPKLPAEQKTPAPVLAPVDLPPAQTASEFVALPTMQQLSMSGQIAVAPLKIDVHVYAGERGKRFVFINMRKYREGERLKEGPLLEEITNTGVILGHQGQRFTIQRN
jgi:general secretion pathway protein B